QEGVSFWRFDLSELPSPLPSSATPRPTGCAHLAFSPDGSRVLCTDQPTYHYEPHTPPSGAPYNVGFNRLYGFSRETRAGVEGYYSVRGAEPLFDHRAPAELDDIEQIWDQSDGQECETCYTKRAELCGGNDAVIANVYCATPPPQAALFARVMWIDFRDPSARVYVDITSLLEDDRGVPRGTLGSFSAACR
ncbi:MAG: hypothetical protein ACO3JL_09105, partial [Myxococcota bacterium]